MLLKCLEFYVITLNLTTFVLFGIDKLAAIKGKQRIRESTLLALAFLGGSLGGLSAMYLFWHKVRKLKFSVGIPFMLILQIAAVFCGVYLFYN